MWGVFKGVERDMWETAGVAGSGVEHCLRFLARLSRGVESRGRLRDMRQNAVNGVEPFVEPFNPLFRRLFIIRVYMVNTVT